MNDELVKFDLTVRLATTCWIYATQYVRKDSSLLIQDQWSRRYMFCKCSFGFWDPKSMEG